MNTHFFKSQGFTLIETLIAVGILALAIAGPMYSANSALVAAEISGQQLTASYLAQEGIEYIRAMRDDEYLASYKQGGADISTNAWDFFINGGGPNPNATIDKCIGLTTTCLLDTNQGYMGTNPPNIVNGGYSLTPCTGLNCAPLRTKNPFNGYTQSTYQTAVTLYTRRVHVESIPSNPNEVRVVSTVTWNSHGSTHTETILENLTPWQ